MGAAQIRILRGQHVVGREDCDVRKVGKEPANMVELPLLWQPGENFLANWPEEDGLLNGDQVPESIHQGLLAGSWFGTAAERERPHRSVDDRHPFRLRRRSVL